MQHLQPNAILQGGKYKIIKVIGQGGFGITYLALQSGLERKVAIKEFFMKELCERDESTSHVTLGTESSRETVNRFRDKFLKEARNIAKLNHPNIVSIHDIFEENGTAYYVMEYAENGSLAEKVKKDEYLSEPVATRYILQVAEALDYLHHQKMNHLDVKPANIMLNEKDEAVLIDFGLSKQYDAVTGNQTSTTPVGISDGYAPMEQYKPGGVCEFSPQTDIYSLGATFFKLLTGTTPPSASDVNEDGVPVNELISKGVSQKAIDIICKAMEGRKKDRMKDARSFIYGLSKNITSSSSETSVAEYNEATVFTPEIQRSEDERRRKGAEAKSAREKAEAERKTKEDAERRQKEEEENARQLLWKSNSKQTWLWILVGIVAIVAVTIGINSLNKTNASYSNGTLIVNGIRYDMVKVQGGTFTMGATSEMIDPFDFEKPTHQVTLTNNYYIGKTEVTQELWESVMGSNPSNFNDAKNPVDRVSWKDCQNFINKLNQLTSKSFRLPTEAEWEFAARGGKYSKQYQYSGSNELDEVAWYYYNSGGKTHDVATKQPNELGIYDMSGNVWEWCSDYWGNYSSSSQTNPTGPSSGPNRVIRGGGKLGLPRHCRSSCRARNPDSSNGFGFRLALSE